MAVELRIRKTALANLERKICEGLYVTGIHKVYDYANKIGLKYHNCKECDAETPTISDVKNDTCALCGSKKYLR
jgi:hypothetical protein